MQWHDVDAAWPNARREFQALAKRGRVVGLDMMEVAPDYDPTDSTAMLAARVLLDTLGFANRYAPLHAGK